MRKLLLSLCLTLFAATMMAVPAKRGIYRTLRLANGTEVRAQLCGDEHIHFFRADDGTCYVADGNGTYTLADMSKLSANAEKRRAPLAARRGKAFAKRMSKRMGAVRKASTATTPTFPELTDGFYGKKKGLIILAQFPDQTFASGHTQAFYNKLANQENYTEGKFVGSVHDFFHDQSNGQFDLTFDVVGPVTLSENSTYYGENDRASKDDKHAGQMVAEACLAVKDKVDWKQYDWDGDHEADQVFVLYAGYGEADYGEAETVWPHMYYLKESDYGKSLNMNGTVVDTYACSNELSLDADEQPTDDGIGTICHEFSHCLGYPDLYDTNTGNGYAMGVWWDLMDGGNTNGDSYCPAGYSGLEKWIAGWKTPVVLTEDTEIKNWRSSEDDGETYIIYNDANSNEFYFIDNRQPVKWDAELPGKGMLVTHVDYDKTAWYQNAVNNDKTHQRWSIIAADNSYYSDHNYRDKMFLNAGHDAYPYNKNNSLSKSSTPKNSVFNCNNDGTRLMGKALTNITQNSDGTMSFKFKLENSSVGPDTPPVKPGDAVLYETFDQCDDKGGNDDVWSNITTSMELKPDVENWSDAGGKAFSGYQCARFGTKKNPANVTSPLFSITGDTELTFKAGAWKNEGGNLQIYYNTDLIATEAVAASQWTDIKVRFTGTGYGTLRFIGIKRLFLDEVCVKAAGATGISSVTDNASTKTDNRIFTIDGRYAGTSISALPKGLYIVGGKKVAK